MTKKQIYIFDLDGTLCELGESINPYNHNGEEISIPGMSIIYESLEEHRHCIILTGRKRKDYGEITEKWLEYNGIEYLDLIMQEGSTARPNHIYKREKLIELKEKYDIIALFDDNEDLIPVCKELGILMLHVHLK